MKSPRLLRLGDLQLRIMKVLWEQGPASVAEVQQALEAETDARSPALAYTTVATMLRKMETRRLVRHKADGRRFIYEAAVAAEAVSRSMADDLVNRVFEGSLAAAVSHLLETRDVSSDELRQLEQLIQHRKKQS